MWIKMIQFFLKFWLFLGLWEDIFQIYSFLFFIISDILPKGLIFPHSFHSYRIVDRKSETLFWVLDLSFTNWKILSKSINVYKLVLVMNSQASREI